ncbi:MAG TPA: TetR/AcrR family transcriptional regulator [Croceibacterium sp.]|nr:TetR/AcrR family transcriptional regulator [Croceibacterium sp.]
MASTQPGKRKQSLIRPGRARGKGDGGGAGALREPRLGRRAASEPRISADDLARVALDLFAERHFASVSIKEIGRAAGVNPAMIYYHFKSKEDLFTAAIQNAIDEAFQLFEEHCHIDDHEDALAAIEAWFDVHVILHKRLRNVVKISLDANSLVNANPEAIEAVKGFYAHEMDILRTYIRSGVTSGLFREVDIERFATMISTSLDGIMARSLILDDFDMAATVEEFKKSISLRLGLAGR